MIPTHPRPRSRLGPILSGAEAPRYPARAARAVLLLLLTLLAHLPLHAAPLSQTPAPNAPHTALRQSLTQHLATPDAAVALLGTGALLILLECNLPGAILPGAAGLLLLLSGVYSLSLQHPRPASILLLLASCAALALATRLPVFGIPAASGTAGLTVGLYTLVPSVHPAIPLAFGLAVGLAASALGRIAWRAHRNKTIRLTSSARPQRVD